MIRTGAIANKRLTTSSLSVYRAFASGRPLVPGTTVARADLPYEIREPSASPDTPAEDRSQLPLKEARDSFEKTLILERLARFGGNVTHTAADLGIERTHLHRKLKSLGIAPNDSSER